MVPALLKEKKKKKTSKTMKHKKKRKSSVEKSPSLNGDNDSSDDLGILSPSKKLHSISFYINSRQEMIDQMFSTLAEEKLRAMLPPILKDESIDDLRSNCLEALLGMSSKRIKSVINGEDLGSQSSETESDTAIESAADDSSSSSSEDAKLDNRGSWKRGIADEVEESPPAKKTTTADSEKDGQSLLEIVELQLRARAIRAALVHQCASETASPENKVEIVGDDDITPSEVQSISIKQEAVSPPRDSIPKPSETEKVNGVSLNTGTSTSENTASTSTEKENILTVAQKEGGRVIVMKKNPNTGGSTIVITKNSSGPSKKNMIVIGPSKKQKNKIVYASKKVLVLDSPGETIRPNFEKINLVVESKVPVVKKTKTSEAVIIEISSESESSQSADKTGEEKMTDEATKEAKLVEASANKEFTLAPEKSMNEMGETTTKESSEEAAGTEGEIKESWVERWLQRSDSSAVAQKKTSKLITSAKQKLLTASRKKTESESDTQQADAESSGVVGTVDEYESLPQSTLPAFEAEIQQVVESLTQSEAERTIVIQETNLVGKENVPDSTEGKEGTSEQVTDETGVMVDADKTKVDLMQGSSETEVNTEVVTSVKHVAADDSEPTCSEEIALELHYQETGDM